MYTLFDIEIGNKSYYYLNNSVQSADKSTIKNGVWGDRPFEVRHRLDAPDI